MANKKNYIALILLIFAAQPVMNAFHMNVKYFQAYLQ